MDRRDVTALVSLAHKEKAQKRWSRARTLFRAASVELSAGASGQGDAATTCLASWAKMEMKLRHDTAARRLFRRAVEAGLSRNADGEVVHARSSTVVALHRWAYLEYKVGGRAAGVHAADL